MNIIEYLEEKEFSKTKKAESFPKGETIINLKETETEEIEFEDSNGKTKTRWIINTQEKHYWAGIQVMKGIQDAINEGSTKAKIIKSGEGINTQYIVLPIQKVE